MILFETIRFCFLASGLMLCVSCAVSANRMSAETCNCQKACLIMILIGATMQLILAQHSVLTGWGMLASIPISVGLSLRLMLDRRVNHCDKVTS